MIMNIELRISE